MNKSGLGRGLSSLISTNAAKTLGNKDSEILLAPVNKISPNRFQPRKSMDPKTIGELADSIKVHGMLQPLVVTHGSSPESYELISGHRRLEASKIAGLKTVPVIVRSADNLLRLELAIIENIQRDNLNSVDEAGAYQRLIDEFDLTQEEVARKTGKSRAAISNMLRLLGLPLEIQKGIVDGKISAGHARAILSVSNPEKQRALYDLILKNELSVRQVEEKVREIQVKSHTRQIKSFANKVFDETVAEIKKSLEEALGTKVNISTVNGKSGKIAIDFYSREELRSIADKII